MDEEISNLPTPDEVRAQLERMTASDDFNRSPQLGAFLRFVVEEVLQGKSDRIKAYTIGVDVLRRDAKFDPQLDPIVRVEATRLRRTIDRYYAGLGADDTIRIDLPRGSYIPTFKRRPAFPGVTAHSSTLDRFWSIRLLMVAIVALIVIAVVVALSQRRVPAPGVAMAPGTAQPTAAALPPGNGLPVMMMPPFEVSGTPGPRSIAARSLQETLSNAFTHFDLVNVQLESADHQVATGNRPRRRAMRTPIIDLPVRSSISTTVRRVCRSGSSTSATAASSGRASSIACSAAAIGPPSKSRSFASLPEHCCSRSA